MKDRFGNPLQSFIRNLIPAGLATSANRWRGQVDASRYLEKGSTMTAILTVSGLSKVVDLIPGGMHPDAVIDAPNMFSVTVKG